MTRVKRAGDMTYTQKHLRLRLTWLQAEQLYLAAETLYDDRPPGWSGKEFLAYKQALDKLGYGLRLKALSGLEPEAAP